MNVHYALSDLHNTTGIEGADPPPGAFTLAGCQKESNRTTKGNPNISDTYTFIIFNCCNALQRMEPLSWNLRTGADLGEIALSSPALEHDAAHRGEPVSSTM